MKRTLLFATIAVCTFNLTVSPRSGVAETTTPAAAVQRAIAIEVLIVGVQRGTDAELALELSGPSDKITARLRELEAEGQIVVIERVRMTTAENQETLFQEGKTVSVATARSSGGRAGPQTAYRQQNLGTQITALARVEGDTMEKEDLQAKLKRLQAAVLEAKRMALQAGKTEDAAQAAYRSAGDDEKADALFRLLEAKAAVRKPRELFRRINAEFQTTQQAYLARLVTE
jgi:type II secretory pathway component GspD/PulD (secretin)